MRKYLLATVIGAMLMAGQAAATDSAVVNLGDRVGSFSDTSSDFSSPGKGYLALSAAVLIGLVAWALVCSHSSGKPASP
jgi:hypothetical protein